MRVGRRRRGRLGPNFLPGIMIVLSVTAMLTYGYVAAAAGPVVGPQIEGAQAGPTVPPATSASIATSSSSTTTSAPPTTSTTTAPTATSSTVVLPASPAPPREGRYGVSSTEVAPEAKQLAADIAYSLTTYEASERLVERLGALEPVTGVELLVRASQPLTHSGSWSRGEVLYPQLGGLTEDRASVMVVVRQTVGTGPEADFTVVRTLDIRLARGESEAWRFDFLGSAGGTFASVDDLTQAHSVAGDPRIEMSDSARLDILAGRVHPYLLRLMSQIAQRTPYAVAVLSTGHPHNVFETDHLSHHTVGRAIDIYRVGDSLVIDDRHEGSATWDLVQWLHGHDDVLQVGGPWDIDGDTALRRSFTNIVHQDHIHVAIDITPEDAEEEAAAGQ